MAKAPRFRAAAARDEFDAVMAVMMLRWLGALDLGTVTWALDVPATIKHAAGSAAPWGSDRPRIEAGIAKLEASRRDH